MAIQYSVAVRNAKMNAIEPEIGTSMIVRIFDGVKPSAPADANVGTILATVNCPADYFNAAAAGAITKLGTWEDTSADATGTAVYFRAFKSDGVTCEMQGDCGTSGTDMILDTTSFVATQPFEIITFTLTDGNA